MNKLTALLFFLLLLILFSPESSAQIYKYVDRDGTVHFTNTPTDPGYKSFMRAEPQEKEASEVPPAGSASKYKTPSKGNDDLEGLDDLDDLDKLDDFEDLPPLPAFP